MVNDRYEDKELLLLLLLMFPLSTVTVKSDPPCALFLPPPPSPLPSQALPGEFVFDKYFSEDFASKEESEEDFQKEEREGSTQ